MKSIKITRNSGLMQFSACFLTEEFLKFSKDAGNDLSTPRPEYNFLGLLPGQKWCLCANRWLEAHEAGLAPPVLTESTNLKTLDIIDFDGMHITDYSIDKCKNFSFKDKYNKLGINDSHASKGGMEFIAKTLYEKIYMK